MSFNKEEYWKNRKAGLAGQGEDPKMKLIGEFTPSTRRYKRQVAKHMYRRLKKDFKAKAQNNGSQV